jgi:hypothetical protein
VKNRPLWPLLTAALIGLPVLYVASFGPACWWASGTISDTDVRIAPQVYWPIGWAAQRSSPVWRMVRSFATLNGKSIAVPVRSDGEVAISLNPPL